MATLISDGAPSERARPATIAAAPGGEAGFGQLLRDARQRRGLSLQQLSQETKISLRHLEELERGDLPLPSERFYRRADVRTYARAVRSDEQLALTLFERAIQAAIPAETIPEPPKPSEWVLSRTRLSIAAAVLLSAAVLGRVVGSPQSVVREAGPVNAGTEMMAAAPARHAGMAGAARLTDAIPVSGSRRPTVEPARLSAPRQAVAPVTPATPLPAADAAAGTTAVLATTGTAATGSPAASFTELVVTTEPVGARVTVNGVGWGVAPVTIRYLTPGAKRVRITKDGFAAEEHVVQLAEGAARTLDVRLTSR